MDNAERIKILSDHIESYLKTVDSPSYSSYVLTKKYGYEKIALNFIGSNVLELGCDESPTTSILNAWSEKLTVVDAVDKFSPKLERGEKLDGVHFVQCMWEDFQPEEKFSDVILTDSLEHVDDAVRVLKCCKSFLADNGRLHIIVPNALSVHRLLGVEMGYMESPYNFNENDISSGHMRVYDHKALEEDILKAGLNIELMEGVQFKPMTDGQLAGFSREFADGLNNLSGLFNWYCAELYACCRIKK